MSPPWLRKRILPLGVALALVVRAHAGEHWPPFLRAPESYPATVVTAVERLWSSPTLERTVEADVAPVPLAAYVRFVDAPDLTAAAARHLGLAGYEVRVLGDDWYAASAGAGAQGVYEVLLREGGRRVILSWGRHRSAFLGTVSGHALTAIDLDDRGHATGQRLTTRVLIDNRAAAALTRTLAPAFGFIIDRKLTEAFQVTSGVVTWALQKPDDFCAWLPRSGLADQRVETLLDTFPHCRPDRSLGARGSSPPGDLQRGERARASLSAPASTRAAPARSRPRSRRRRA